VPEWLPAILEAIADGLPTCIAADLVGVPRKTVEDWLADPTTDVYRQCKQAEAERIKATIERLREAPPKDWTRWAWFLERWAPEWFGRRQFVEAKTEQVSSGIEIVVLTAEQVAERREAADRAGARTGEGAGE
jgi:hypothetical protein